jgi:hypothetical protein
VRSRIVVEEGTETRDYDYDDDDDEDDDDDDDDDDDGVSYGTHNYTPWIKFRDS